MVMTPKNDVSGRLTPSQNIVFQTAIKMAVYLEFNTRLTSSPYNFTDIVYQKVSLLSPVLKV